MESKRIKILRKILNLYSFLGIVFIILGSVLILTPALPSIWYSLNGEATAAETASLVSQVEAIEDRKSGYTVEEPVIEEDPKLSDYGVIMPEFDSDLTETNTLYIDTIGVDAPINTGSDADAELEKGVWLTYGWGTPEDQTPIILASHRFGYVYWTNEFRREQSFYNLPRLNPGDEISIVWNQREYIYQVTEKYEGTDFKDLDSDLILYTCKMFNSPVRIFVEANRVN